MLHEPCLVGLAERRIEPHARLHVDRVVRIGDRAEGLEHLVDVGALRAVERDLDGLVLEPIAAERGERFAVAQLDRCIEHVAHIVFAVPHLRHTAVHVAQRVHGLHAGAHRVLGREDRIARLFGELADEREVDGAVRHHVRPVSEFARHEERVDVRHHDRDRIAVVGGELVDPVGRHTHVVEPFLADLLTRAVLHLLADVVARVVGQQRVDPHADLVGRLVAELLVVDRPAHEPVRVLDAHDAAGHGVAAER